MKKIDLLKLEMENFCLFSEKMTLDLSKPGLTLISGPNGSGKTTMFESLPYTAWGVTSKGLRADQVINNIVGKNCFTAVDFKVEDDYFRIERYRNHSKYQNSLFLFQNGKDISKGTIRKTTSLIDSIFTPSKVFMSTLFFAQKTRAFFTTLTDVEQKEIFRRILRLDDFVVYQEVVKEQLNSLISNVSDYKNQISIKDALLEELHERLKELEKERVLFYDKKCIDIENLEGEIAVLERKLVSEEDVKKELSNLIKKIEELQDSLNLVTKFINEKSSKLELEISNINSKRAQLVEEVNSRISLERENNIIEKDKEKQKIIIETDQKLKELSLLRDESFSKKSDYRETFVKLNANRDQIINDIEKLNKVTSSTEDIECPYCTQPITENLKQNLLERTKKLAEEKIIIETEIKNISSSIEQVTNEIEKIDLEIKNIELNQERELGNIEGNFSSRLDDIEKSKTTKIQELQERSKILIEEAKEKNETETMELFEKETFLKSSIQEKKSEIENVEKELSDLQLVKHDLEVKKEALVKKKEEEFDEGKIENTQKKISDTVRTKSSIQEKIKCSEEKSTIYEFWKKGFSQVGIPAMLIDEAIPFMNQKVNEYLTEVSAGRYVVSFDTMKATKSGEFRDKISVNVLDTVHKANEREQLSGGQERLIDICILFTLLDLQSTIQNVDFNILLLDEVFDSLDDDNILSVSKLLRTKAKSKGIFVISHRHINEFDADNHLEFRI